MNKRQKRQYILKMSGIMILVVIAGYVINPLLGASHVIWDENLARFVFVLTLILLVDVWTTKE